MRDLASSRSIVALAAALLFAPAFAEPEEPPKPRTYTLNLVDEVILDDVVQFLRDISDRNFVIGADVIALGEEEELTCRLRIEDATLEQTLSLLCLATHPRLTWRVGPGEVIVFALAEEALPLAERQDLPGGDEKADGELRDSLAKRMLTLDFKSASPLDVFDFLGDVLGGNLVLTARARKWIAAEDPSVSLRLRDIGTTNALAILCDQLEGLSWTVSHGAIVVDAEA